MKKYKDNIEGALEVGLDTGVYFFTEALTEEEAIEFIEYNTIRSLPYIKEQVRPIIIFHSETLNHWLTEVTSFLIQRS